MLKALFILQCVFFAIYFTYYPAIFPSNSTLSTNNTSILNDDIQFNQFKIKNSDEQSHNTVVPYEAFMYQNKNKIVLVSEEELRQQYYSKFKDLEMDTKKKLNNLLHEAYNAYKQRKENNESVSFFDFYNKYKKAVDRLERNTDDRFHVLYSEFKEDLRMNGFDEDIAQEYLDTYQKAKKQQRHQLFIKALELL